MRGRGYTLVEALVALVLLSGGLLVAAGATLAALRHERAAAQRSIAARAAASLADELRARPRADGRALRAVGGVDPALACADHPPSCPAEHAAAASLAATSAWLADALPAGAVLRVEARDDGTASYRIELSWPDGEAQPARLLLATDT